jgi:hypothetical protein
MLRTNDWAFDVDFDVGISTDQLHVHCNERHSFPSPVDETMQCSNSCVVVVSKNNSNKYNAGLHCVGISFPMQS